MKKTSVCVCLPFRNDEFRVDCLYSPPVPGDRETPDDPGELLIDEVHLLVGCGFSSDIKDLLSIEALDQIYDEAQKELSVRGYLDEE